MKHVPLQRPTRAFSLRRLLVRAATGSVLAAPCLAPAADTFTPDTGGPGGGPYEMRCAARSRLVGIEGRAGLGLDAVRPVCATFNNGRAGEARRFPDWTGGPGGSRVEARCAPGDPSVYVTRIQAHLPASGKAGVPSGLTVFCGATRKKLGNPGPAWTDHACPIHLYPVGIHGRSGKFVDSIGLICGTGGS